MPTQRILYGSSWCEPTWTLICGVNPCPKYLTYPAYTWFELRVAVTFCHFKFLIFLVEKKANNAYSTHIVWIKLV